MISHYPTVSMCAEISVFTHVTWNMHTLRTLKKSVNEKLGQVPNVEYINFYTLDRGLSTKVNFSSH